MRKQIKKVLTVVMSMAMTVVMLPTVSKTNVEAVATRYEAENADYGTNTLQNDTWYASASNGAVVGMNGSWASDPYKTVTWTVNVETAGDYILTVGYCTKLQVELLAQVNGGDWYKFSEADPITFVLPASEDWNKAATATLKVTLNEGENTITVTGPIVDWNANWTAVYNQTGWPTANLDYIEIEKFSGEEVIPDAIGTQK